MDILKTLAEEFKLKVEQVESTVALIDEGNTIPFISRYRKEVTGGLDDATLRDLFDRLSYLRKLDERRSEISNLIDGQGKLTPEITFALDQAKTLVELEDIYRPYRPKRTTRASIARAKGLEPLARFKDKLGHRKGLGAHDLVFTAVHREKQLGCRRLPDGYCHGGGHLTEERVGRENADRADDHVGIPCRHDHGVFPRRAKVSARLQHGSGGNAVGADGVKLKSGEGALQLLAERGTEAAALPVNDYNFHGCSFRFSKASYQSEILSFLKRR